MAKRAKRLHSRSGHRVHREAMPTRRLVAVETTRGTVTAALVGCAVALMLTTLGMLVAHAVAGPILGHWDGTPDRLGRGIVASAVGGIVVLGLVAGFLATAARFALADLYARLDSKDQRLRGTLLVRGQVSASPFGPASASVAALGGLALLAAIPSVVLAAEHAGRLDDELHRAAFVPWVSWAVAFIVIVLLAATAMWWLTRADRRWAASVGGRLPPGVVGHAGPAVRVTSRAQRRAARARWDVLDWVGWSGRLGVALGAGAVFLGVFLHQPGLYAEPIRYNEDIERLIATGITGGGVMVVLGLAMALSTGIVSLSRTLRAVRRAASESRSVTDDDRGRMRAATTSLTDAVTVAQVMWAALAAVACGWWFAVHVETPADSGSAAVPVFDTAIGGMLVLVVWLLCGAALIAARAALCAQAPAVRNRFGYDVPSEADDREFPDVMLLGQ